MIASVSVVGLEERHGTIGHETSSSKGSGAR